MLLWPVRWAGSLPGLAQRNGAGQHAAKAWKTSSASGSGPGFKNILRLASRASGFGDDNNLQGQGWRLRPGRG